MKLPYIMLFFVMSNFCFGQGKYDANWCFGDLAGINFADISHPTNFPTVCNSTIAGASISDSLGNLLLYVAPDTPFNLGSSFLTNNAIYDANNNIIFNGDSLVIGLQLKAAMFLPVPGKPNSFLFFYIKDIDSVQIDSIDDTEHRYGNLYYALIDKDSAGYEVLLKNQLLLTDPVERGITATKHANGKDWWLLVHESNEWIVADSNNTFYRFLITEDSITGPIEQDIGTVHSANHTDFSEMFFSRDGNLLACALVNQPVCDLYNFNRCTGELYNYVPISNINNGELQTEGCAFSNDGSKVYFTNGGGNNGYDNFLVQYSVNFPDIPYSKVVLYDSLTITFSFGDLQLAPDNKIYMAVNDSNLSYYLNGNYSINNQYLWVINNPDSAGTTCNFQPYGYYLGDSARVFWGLPNMPNYNLGPLSIYQAGAGTDTTICSKDSVIIGSPPVAGVTYAWQPAQGITDKTFAQQTVKPDSSTWYYVTLTDTTIQFACQSRTDSVYVQVKVCCDTLLLSQCTLSKDTFICTDKDTPTKGATLFASAPQGIVLTWQSGFGIDSVHTPEQIVDPPQSAWYYVTFTDTTSSGSCNSKTDSVYVKVETCLGIEEINSATQHLIIYPNPAQNIAVVEWQPVDGQLELSVTDLLGRIVRQAQYDGSSGKGQINVSELANGLYLARLLSNSGETQATGKLAIAR